MFDRSVISPDAKSLLRSTPFSPFIIQYSVWLYFRFPLSYRDVEDLLAERGVEVSYETVRRGLKLMPKLLKTQGYVPDAIVTDKLPFYGSALRELSLSRLHDFGGSENNRAEIFHLPIRQRERRMKWFKSAKSAQRFLFTHAAIYNTFKVQRHLISRQTMHRFREEAVWLFGGHRDRPLSLLPCSRERDRQRSPSGNGPPVEQ